MIRLSLTIVVCIVCEMMKMKMKMMMMMMLKDKEPLGSAGLSKKNLGLDMNLARENPKDARRLEGFKIA